MSKHTKAISSKMVAGSKRERSSLTSEERKKRFGSGGMRGKHHSDATKAKMSAAALSRGLMKIVI
jgi:hypothetical protein